MARRTKVTEDLAALLCLLDEEDTVKSIHGSLASMPRRRHWDTLAEPLRDGYRRDAARIIAHLRPKLAFLAGAPDISDEL